MKRGMVVAITFMFPIGIWFTMLGYELEGMMLMVSGWTAIVILGESGRDERRSGYQTYDQMRQKSRRP